MRTLALKINSKGRCRRIGLRSRWLTREVPVATRCPVCKPPITKSFQPWEGTTALITRSTKDCCPMTPPRSPSSKSPTLRRATSRSAYSNRTMGTLIRFKLAWRRRCNSFSNRSKSRLRHSSRAVTSSHTGNRTRFKSRAGVKSHLMRTMVMWKTHSDQSKRLY